MQETLIHTDSQRFYDLVDRICDRVKELHRVKSSTYGTAAAPLDNIERSVEFGVEPWRYALIEAKNCQARLSNWALGKESDGEPIENAFIDTASWSVIGLIELEKSRGES